MPNIFFPGNLFPKVFNSFLKLNKVPWQYINNRVNKWWVFYSRKPGREQPLLPSSWLFIVFLLVGGGGWVAARASWLLASDLCDFSGECRSSIYHQLRRWAVIFAGVGVELRWVLGCWHAKMLRTEIRPAKVSVANGPWSDAVHTLLKCRK